jgi:hypothetical protein
VYILFPPCSSSYPFPHHLPDPDSRQKLFCTPLLWFCRRKKIKGNKKNMAFLLIWDEHSYTERFLVLFPCMYVLQPKLVNLYQSSSLLPRPLSSLRLIYSFQYSEHVNHIQVFGFLPLPYPSCVQSSLSVTHVQ